MKTDLIEVVSKYIVVGMFIGFLALCVRYSILLDKALQ